MEANDQCPPGSSALVGRGDGSASQSPVRGQRGQAAGGGSAVMGRLREQLLLGWLLVFH